MFLSVPSLSFSHTRQISLCRHQSMFLFSLKVCLSLQACQQNKFSNTILSIGVFRFPFYFAFVLVIQEEFESWLDLLVWASSRHVEVYRRVPRMKIISSLLYACANETWRILCFVSPHPPRILSFLLIFRCHYPSDIFSSIWLFFVCFCTSCKAKEAVVCMCEARWPM